MTRTDTVLGEIDGWCTLMTTFIDGQVCDPTPMRLHGMAAALGQLHNLRVDNDANVALTIGKSWWYPEIAIPAALQQYAIIAQDLPKAWQATVSAFCATLSAIQDQADALPRTIIHGDGWVGNAVQTASDQVIFIDWEPSGHGIAVLDLGRLLLHCHHDLATPLSKPIEPSVWRVNAVVDGYCAARIPTPTERAMLVDAIRFGVAFGAVTHFASAQRTQWHEHQPERLTRRQHWYAVSEVIAELAQKRFDELL
jgi:Ser/Thr protein kinase RdoA (MazF antagonist)